MATQTTPLLAPGLRDAIAELDALLGPRASVAAVQREQHSSGESYHPAALPDVVCFPRSTEEVSAIVKISARYQLPVIPFGAGTSVEGQVNAIHGGITINLREMNKVLRISVEDLDTTVEAGVTRLQLNKHLQNTGLTFFIDPGADATIGGMTATRASGTTAVRYGTMRENVLSLTLVLADGRIIKTGTRARKSSAGYDLTHLFVGSEGTLGVITEVTLRLHPLPEAVSAAVCAFSSIEGAVQTAIEAIQLGLNVARIEFLDDKQIEAINLYSRTDLPALPTLFFEFHGMNLRDVSDQAAILQPLAEEHGGRGFQWKNSLEDRDVLWKARHDAYFAAMALRPSAKVWTTDVCVPISRLAECITLTKQDLQTVSFPAPIVGHVGDGNFHVLCVLDPENPSDFAEASAFSEKLVKRAQSMGGTCTGEHGIGSGKMKHMRDEHGEALDVMHTIKRALDPDNRMNPGKIVDLTI
jgi:D-lactate dehydrogenase (cytochrome)